MTKYRYLLLLTAVALVPPGEKVFTSMIYPSFTVRCFVYSKIKNKNS